MKQLVKPLQIFYRRRHKIIAVLAAITTLLLGYQNCGKNNPANENLNSMRCHVSRVSPDIFIDSSRSFGQQRFQINQTVHFGVGMPPDFVMQTCGATTSQEGHWLLPDGSIINDYCVTINNAQPGNYTLKWIFPIVRSNCEEPGPDFMGIAVNFTAQ